MGFLWDFYGLSVGFLLAVSDHQLFKAQAMEKRLTEATKRLAPLRKFRQARDLLDSMGIDGGFSWDLSWDIPENYGKLWKATQIP